MTVFGLMMVKDEDDIVGLSAAHLLAHVDHVLVLENGSTDGTAEILHELADQTGRMTVIDDPEPGYYQSAKMTALANRAHEEGATWVLPCDADEFFDAGGGRIGTLLDAVTDDTVDIVECDFFHYCHTPLDPPWTNAPASMQWRERASQIPKVAVRWGSGLEITQGNHGALYHGFRGTPASFRAVVHHYPYRTLEQYQRKVTQGWAAYLAADGLPEGYGYHWKEQAEICAGEDGGAAHYRRMTWRQDPKRDESLIFDPFTPWAP